MTIVAKLPNGAWCPVSETEPIHLFDLTPEQFGRLCAGDYRLADEAAMRSFAPPNIQRSQELPPELDFAPNPIPFTDAPVGYVWVSRFGGHGHLVLAKEAVGEALCGCPEPGILRSFKLPENSAGACPSCLVRLERSEVKQ